MRSHVETAITIAVLLVLIALLVVGIAVTAR